MIQHKITTLDVLKIQRAYDDLSRMIEKVEESNLRYGRKANVSPYIIDAHQCLKEVLSGMDEES